MLHLHLVFIGKTSFPEMEAGIQRYLDRLRHYVPVEVHLIRAEKITSRISDELVKARESERILKLPARQDYFIAWDQKGHQMDSPELANFLGRLGNEGIPTLWMAIGGPVGLSAAILERANLVLSLSRMTFPHDLARLIIVEQIYRAFTILKGEPYHK